MKKIIPFLTGFVFLAACNNHSSQMPSSNKDTSATMMNGSSSYSVDMVDNAKDPICGMPTTTEIGDTLHFNNRVIGFCSKDCKDEFLKDAKKNFAAVEWKK